uniref:Putative secreted protein n=1 Tax=Ixodes ricinus TaxID=34613 RepID=A0A6B0UZR1_IXORI
MGPAAATMAMGASLAFLTVGYGLISTLPGLLLSRIGLRAAKLTCAHLSPGLVVPKLVPAGLVPSSIKRMPMGGASGEKGSPTRAGTELSSERMIGTMKWSSNRLSICFLTCAPASVFLSQIICRAVCPNLFSALRSHRGWASRSSTAPMWPNLQAKCNGVSQRPLSGVFRYKSRM